MTDNTARNQTIIALAEQQKWSYGVIARELNVTIGTVSGVIFRHRYPKKQRIASRHGDSPNKIGTGWRRSQLRPRRSLRSTVGDIAP